MNSYVVHSSSSSSSSKVDEIYLYKKNFELLKIRVCKKTFEYTYT